jgi:hypothetical protein
MTCIMGASTLHYEMVYLLSYAVGLLRTRLGSYNISGGEHNLTIQPIVV